MKIKHQSIKCSNCKKQIEILPQYQKYLEEYLGMPIRTAQDLNIKFICSECAKLCKSNS